MPRIDCANITRPPALFPCRCHPRQLHPRRGNAAYHPAHLSGQVKELEERYGTKLFVRHGRRIELTDIGKSAFNITRLLFRHEEEVEHLLQSARALTSGELRVAADSPYIATPLLAQFQRLYPGIQISIQYGNSQQLMSWIESRRCDVAFSAQHSRRVMTGCSRFRCHRTGWWFSSARTTTGPSDARSRSKNW